MTNIQTDQVVEIEYTLKGDNGEVIDSSKEMGPLAFIQGKKNIIPGLESEMEGKKLGDSFNVSIDPENAYGARNESMIQSVPKDQFGENAEKVQIGDRFQVQDQDEQLMVVQVIEIKENEIVLDANHPMAGKTLHFDVEIVSVRNATEEELKRGHLTEEESSCCDTNDSCC